MLLFQSASQSKREGSSVRRPVPHHPTLRQRELVCTRGSVPKNAQVSQHVCARDVSSQQTPHAQTSHHLCRTIPTFGHQVVGLVLQRKVAALGRARRTHAHGPNAQQAAHGLGQQQPTRWCTPDDFRPHPQQGSGCKWPSNPILGPKRMARSCARPRKLESQD